MGKSSDHRCRNEPHCWTDGWETISVSSVRSGAGYTRRIYRRRKRSSLNKQKALCRRLNSRMGIYRISILFTNLGLKDSYGMRQIRIYVQHERKEILFALAQASVPKEIPAEAVMPLYSLAQDFRIQFPKRPPYGYAGS